MGVLNTFALFSSEPSSPGVPLPPGPPPIDPSTGLATTDTPPPVNFSVLVPATAPDPSTIPQDNASQSNYVASMLRQCNRDLLGIAQSLGPAPPKSLAGIAADLNTERQRYQTILSAYNDAYRVMFGRLPDQTGLQQWQLWIGVGVGIVAIGYAAYELHQHIQNTKQALANQAKALQNAAYAAQQCAASQQAGDSASAQMWCAIAKSSSDAANNGGGQSATDWIKENWPWVALAGAALVILPDLV